MSLQGKKILITAGPTWVPIDRVRVISNIATGKTGIYLAKEAQRRGATVTLLLGPVGSTRFPYTITVKRFCYFDELHTLMKKELKLKKYDIVIHSAAVSDYKPRQAFYSKIKSNIKNFSLALESTVKIADKVKRYAPHVYLILFKLELDRSRSQMIQDARLTMREAHADLAIVNTFSRKGIYKAFIIDKRKSYCQFRSKEELARALFQLPFFS